MLVCDLTLPAPEENLACDEALLDLCEAGQADELLRFWEPAQSFVVLGYANQAATEVDLPFCRQNAIPVLRRCSGGGTVLQGPGCLDYTLILRISNAAALQSISGTNDYILQRQREALGALLGVPVDKQGHTDLAIGGLKFSGNAQRRRKDFLLFHGSFLLQMDIALVERALRMPSKQPDYRLNRSHTDFLMNLKLPPHLVKEALLKAWAADGSLTSIPAEEISRLVREKYGREEWNLKF